MKKSSGQKKKVIIVPEKGEFHELSCTCAKCRSAKRIPAPNHPWRRWRVK